jgi:hypothetical protein
VFYASHFHGIPLYKALAVLIDCGCEAAIRILRGKVEQALVPFEGVPLPAQNAQRLLLAALSRGSYTVVQDTLAILHAW